MFYNLGARPDYSLGPVVQSILSLKKSLVEEFLGVTVVLSHL